MTTDVLPKLFEGKVTTPAEGCWEWLMFLNHAGYGQCTINNRRWLAHRYVYSTVVADIPEDLIIMHTCDNPKCVRPSHLRLGTHAQNQHDKIAKGKGNEGERNAHAKFTQAQVESIRARVAAGERAIRIAEEFGVNRSCISKIVNKTHWR